MKNTDVKIFLLEDEMYPGFKAEDVLPFLKIYLVYPGLKLKEIFGNPPKELRNMMKRNFVDRTLAVKELDVPAPVKLGECKMVLITVPKPRDEANDCGDIHMKFIPEHYLKIANQILYIPNHWRRGDFLIPAERRCAVTRHFIVRPESLGKEIVADINILLNSNGSISINIEEVTADNFRKKSNDEIAFSQPPQPEFKISMPPIKPGDEPGPNLFLIPGTDKCIKFTPSAKKLEKLN